MASFMDRMRAKQYAKQDAKPAGPWERIPGIQEFMRSIGCTTLVDEATDAYKNNHYVLIMCRAVATPWGPVERVMIQRCDGGPIRSWADMQAIKNRFYGLDRTGVEVFPAESQKFDVANVYHLWIFPEGFRLPFGKRDGDKPA